VAFVRHLWPMPGAGVLAAVLPAMDVRQKRQKRQKGIGAGIVHVPRLARKAHKWLCLVQRDRKSWYAPIGGCDLIGLSRFSRPCGTTHLLSFSPGLRPGLNSARPCGTRRRAEIKKVTASE
jgi:hypothetical protein